jgi:hypothetical protein
MPLEVATEPPTRSGWRINIVLSYEISVSVLCQLELSPGTPVRGYRIRSAGDPRAAESSLVHPIAPFPTAHVGK